MTERKIAIVSEPAPQLLEFESGAIRKHLRDYAAYENRLDIETEVVISLRKTMDKEMLDSCLQLSYDMTGVKVVRRLPDGEANLKKRKKILTERSLMTHAKLDDVKEEKEKRIKNKSNFISWGR